MLFENDRPTARSIGLIERVITEINENGNASLSVEDFDFALRDALDAMKEINAQKELVRTARPVLWAVEKLELISWEMEAVIENEDEHPIARMMARERKKALDFAISALREKAVRDGREVKK